MVGGTEGGEIPKNFVGYWSNFLKLLFHLTLKITIFSLVERRLNMEKDRIEKLNNRFEEYAYEQDGIEYWLARELQELLDYTQWRNFENVISKAKIACENSGNAISDHFADVSKTIAMPKGAEKEVQKSIKK